MASDSGMPGSIARSDQRMRSPIEPPAPLVFDADFDQVMEEIGSPGFGQIDMN